MCPEALEDFLKSFPVALVFLAAFWSTDSTRFLDFAHQNELKVRS
jgi:hypothetical protein